MLAMQSAIQAELIAAIQAPLIFFAAIALGRWLKRSQGVQLGISYFFFCGILALYIPLFFFGPDFLPQLLHAKQTPPTAVPAQYKDVEHQLQELENQLKATRLQLTGQTTPNAPIPPVAIQAPANTYPFLHHLSAALAILGCFVVMALVRRYFWELWFERKQRTRAPKFLSQLFSLVLFITTIVMVIATVYGKDLTAFLFGSTVVVGIIGFAMQDLLGNIIAGIALELGKPFKTGDWLVVDKIHAEVIEVNWRSTRLRTNDHVYLDIPNKSIVGTTITNLTYPTKQHALRIRVGFDYSTPPNFVKDCLIRATRKALGVLQTPGPKVFLCEFGDSSVNYEIKFWIENEGNFNDICDAIRTNIWYEAQRHQIKIPYPIRTLHVERNQQQPDRAIGSDLNILRKQPFLQLFNPEQANTLLTKTRILRFGRGETIIQQGDSGHSMFIILEGEASVSVSVNGQSRHVATLKEADYFGEMSLLTGEPRTATIIAQDDCRMWEIEKSVLAGILQENKELADKLGELLAARRMETEGVLAATDGKSELTAKRREYTQGILTRLYSFFEL